MTMPMIKLPLKAALNASLDMLRLRSTATDAIVLIIDERTGAAQVGSLRGDINHTAQLLSRALQAVQKQRGNGSGLIGI